MHLTYVLKARQGNFVVCNRKRATNIIVTLTLLAWKNYNNDSNGRKEIVKVRKQYFSPQARHVESIVTYQNRCNNLLHVVFRVPDNLLNMKIFEVCLSDEKCPLAYIKSIILQSPPVSLQSKTKCANTLVIKFRGAKGSGRRIQTLPVGSQTSCTAFVTL